MKILSISTFVSFKRRTISSFEKYFRLKKTVVPPALTGHASNFTLSTSALLSAYSFSHKIINSSYDLWSKPYIKTLICVYAREKKLR